MEVESNNIKIESKSTTSWTQGFICFQIRPLGVLFTAALAIYIYKLINNRASLQLLVPPAFTAEIKSLTTKMIQLRKNHPNLFCGLATLILGTLAIIGHVVSFNYLVLIGLIIAGLLSTGYNFKIVKVPLKVDLSWADKFDREIGDEFLPDVNESNLFVLQRASIDAVITPTTACGGADDDDDDKSEEISSELLLPDSIPEIDENSDSSDDYMIMKPSKVSKSATNQEIQFKKGYFKKDSSFSTTSSSSSSDDENNLSKGLNFDNVDSKAQFILPEHLSQSTPAPAVPPQTTAINLASQLPGLVTNFMSWSMGGAGASSGDTGSIVATTATTSAHLNQKLIHNHPNVSATKNDLSDNIETISLDTTDDDSDFEIVETDTI